MKYVTRYLIKNADGGYLVRFWPHPNGNMSVWGPKSEATPYPRRRAHELAKELHEHVVRCVRTKP